jgi:hypothetical protein
MSNNQILSDVCILFVLITLSAFGYFGATIAVGVPYGLIVWSVIKHKRNKND